MPPSAARRQSASAPAASPSSARRTPSDVAACRSPASAARPSHWVAPPRSPRSSSNQPSASAACRSPSWGRALQAGGSLVLAAEALQCDAEFAHGRDIAGLRRPTQEPLGVPEPAHPARADAELRRRVRLPASAPRRSQRLGLLVLAPGVEQHPDARHRPWARLVVLGGAAEPALGLVVPVRIVERAGKLLGRLVAPGLGRGAQHRHRLVLPVVLAQQRREVHRRDLVAELDAAAVDRLGLVVAAHPAQHASEVVGRVDLAALERPPVPAPWPH